MFFWKLRFLWLQSIFAVCFPKFLGGRTPTSLGRCKIMESLCLAGEMFWPRQRPHGPLGLAGHGRSTRWLLSKMSALIPHCLVFETTRKVLQHIPFTRFTPARPHSWNNYKTRHGRLTPASVSQKMPLPPYPTTKLKKTRSTTNTCCCCCFYSA